MNQNSYRLMPWAWSAAWLLTGLGISIADIYSLPSQSLIATIAYIVLSAVGWGFAGIVTVSAARRKSGTVIGLVSWAVAYLAFLLLGLIWLHSWNLAFLGPIVAIGVAGAIGGITTSLRSGVWRLASGALLGLAFFLFAAVSFYASYFLIFFYTPEAQLFGNAGAGAFIWGLPEALCGLGVGFLARWMLGITAVGPKSVSP